MYKFQHASSDSFQKQNRARIRIGYRLYCVILLQVNIPLKLQFCYQ